MEKIITFENVRSFAYVNTNIVKKPIKGIVLSFTGLGGMGMYDEDSNEGKMFADLGIIYIYPYNNPWNWMNKQAVAYTDEIVDVITKEFDLPEDIPVVSTGGSMGGQSALVYTRYSKRTPVACVANCPVCDTPFHFTERPDLPRTLYSALFNEPGTAEDALKSISPLHLAPSMPDVKYYIFHCNNDKAVNIQKHSETFIDELRKYCSNITYHEVPDRGHCDLTPEMKSLYFKYQIDAILTENK